MREKTSFYRATISIANKKRIPDGRDPAQEDEWLSRAERATMGNVIVPSVSTNSALLTTKLCASKRWAAAIDTGLIAFPGSTAAHLLADWRGLEAGGRTLEPDNVYVIARNDERFAVTPKPDKLAIFVAQGNRYNILFSDVVQQLVHVNPLVDGEA